MAGETPKEIAALLAGLLSKPNADLLRQIDLDNMELGSFVKAYASPPPPADISVRSSIREDTVIAEISRLLSETGADSINVLDACCGLAVLPKRIIQSVGRKIERVSYWAIDEDPSCIKTIRAQQKDFEQFRSFSPMQRHITDLEGLSNASMDLIFLNNALHEIPPRFYPKIFSTFNSLLNPERGLICIVDMESLPDDSPESIAITWNGAEVEQFLRAGGFSPAVTLHEKVTVVYQAQIRHAPLGVNETSMLRQIDTLIQEKLHNAILDRQKIEAGLTSNPSKYQPWIVLTGTIARCAEELYLISSAL